MADLNLVPNPVVTVVQAGIFLANAYVVKKMMLEPYLRVKEKRLSRTVSSENKAEKMLNESKEIRTKISESLKQAHMEISETSKQSKKTALNEQQAILVKAQEISASHFESSVKDVQASLEESLKQVPTVITGLVDEMYDKAISIR